MSNLDNENGFPGTGYTGDDLVLRNVNGDITGVYFIDDQGNWEEYYAEYVAEDQGPRNKITNIKVKKDDGTYSNLIPIAVFAENVNWDGNYNIKQILGNVNMEAGDVQTQINNLNDITSLHTSQIGVLNNITSTHTSQIDVLNGLVPTINNNTSRINSLYSDIAPYYSSHSIYDVGQFVLYDNILYKCGIAITTPEEFDISKWSSTKITYEFGSGGGSATTLNQLTDVEIYAPEAGQILRYDGANKVWFNGSEQLNNLSDVYIGSPNNNQILKYDSTNNLWVNSINTINGLANVNISGLSDGQILKFDGTSQNWINTDIVLNNLDDVNINQATDGQVLKYDSTSQKWINGTDNDTKQLSRLTDVNVNSRFNNQVLVYDETVSKWVSKFTPTQHKPTYNSYYPLSSGGAYETLKKLDSYIYDSSTDFNTGKTWVNNESIYRRTFKGVYTDSTGNKPPIVLTTWNPKYVLTNCEINCCQIINGIRYQVINANNITFGTGSNATAASLYVDYDNDVAKLYFIPGCKDITVTPITVEYIIVIEYTKNPTMEKYHYITITSEQTDNIWENSEYGIKATLSQVSPYIYWMESNTIFSCDSITIYPDKLNTSAIQGAYQLSLNLYDSNSQILAQLSTGLDGTYGNPAWDNGLTLDTSNIPGPYYLRIGISAQCAPGNTLYFYIKDIDATNMDGQYINNI